MTNEEAIEVLKDLWRYEHSEFSEKDIREALDMAISALSQMESAETQITNSNLKSESEKPIKHFGSIECPNCGRLLMLEEQTMEEVKQNAFDILDQKLTEEYDKSEGMEKRTLKMVFEFMSEAICEAEQTYGWCKGCKEYDTEKHCCHRYSSFIRESLQDSINAVLEDIKAELKKYANHEVIAISGGEESGLYIAIGVLDKHISEYPN